MTGETRITDGHRDGVPTVVLENGFLRVEVAPGIGGRVVSLQHLSSGREFLWRNPNLALVRSLPGAEYDPNFYGGMDELLPNDAPEVIDGITCPDHGELWTLPLTAETREGELILSGRLPLFGLAYERSMGLEENRLICRYRITNPTTSARRFLWKLHAALAVRRGDRIVCPAGSAQAADPAWSRRKTTAPFDWPSADGLDMSIVPEPDGSTEFLYLYDLRDGLMALEAADGAGISCRFDTSVFPCCWYFASHGGMDGAFVGVLEPCTNMPMSVNEADAEGFCAGLQPGDQLETTVVWTLDAPTGRKKA